MYKKEGFVAAEMGGVVTLIVGVGIAALVLIFVSTLGGQTYQLTESKITAISDANVKADVTAAAKSGFTAMKTVGDYLPLIVLAIVIFIVLGLVMGLGRSNMGGGSAL